MGGKARPLVLCGCTHPEFGCLADHTPAAPREPCSLSETQSLEVLYAAAGDFGWKTWNVANNDPLERSQLAKSVPTSPRDLKEATRARGRRMSYASLEPVGSFSSSQDTLNPRVWDTRCRFPSPIAPHLPHVPRNSAPHIICPRIRPAVN